MKAIIALLILIAAVSPEETCVEVDRIEDNNIAVVSVHHGKELKMVDVPAEDFNEPIAEGNKIAETVVVGKFHEGFIDAETNEKYYQFKSNDDAVWWLLTVEEIGFTPEANKEYTLIYYNNDTTECLECAEELDCECELYDDIFLAIFEGGN